MQLSTRGQVALAAVMAVARGSTAEKPMRLEVVGVAVGVSVSYLEQLFARLRRAGVVRGVRGPGGGYHVPRLAELTVWDVVAAVDVQDSVAHETAGVWAGAVAALVEHLRGVKLKDLP